MKRRSGIGDARAYTPRGRTVRDTGEVPRGRPVAREGEGRRAVPPGKRVTRDGSRPVRPRIPPKKAKLKAPPQLPKMGEPRRRLRLATAVSLLLFAVIGLRLVQLQLTDAPAYAAAGLIERLAKIQLIGHRGSIYDRTGAVLAHSIEAAYVAADPERIENPEATAIQLAPYVQLSKSEILPKLAKRKLEVTGEPLRFQYLARGIDMADAEKVRAMNLPGIRVERDERRELPGHDLAANIIGFTGTDMTGLGGIEDRLNDVLQGHNGELVYEVGQGELRKPIPDGYRREDPARPGRSLKLTIDSDTQFVTQRILAEHMAKMRATFGAAVVMDVKTGEIVAQASYPTYDAMKALAYKPSDRIDAATSVVVEPGSVHKAIVLAAALEEGVVKPDSTVVIGPSVTKGDEQQDDHIKFPQGTPITLPGIMALSSNVGTIAIADKLGAQKLYDYQLKFGLGEKTGIGVPGEAAGLVQPPKNWSDTAYGTIPIGLGVAVTPLQMIAAYAAIANDGVWVQPHLVLEEIDANGKVTKPAPPKSHRVVSPETAAALRQIMVAVTTVDGATGRAAAMPGYLVAGKTGTGQRVLNGKYMSGNVGSFIGMAPADNPRYVIGVFAHSGGSGKEIAPAFRQMMDFTMRRFKVPPTGARPPKFVIHY